EDREVKKILRKLTAEVGRVARPLTNSIEAMAKLDYVTAKARFARDYNHTRPDINVEGRLWLRLARHPLLEAFFRREGEAPAEPSAPAGIAVATARQEPRPPD